MAKQLPALNERLIHFIEAQKLFFVATAGAGGRINLSPKGMDSLRVLDDNRIAWLNLTGSGNETAAHILEQNRMTVMFCAFEGNPLILRLYGSAEILHDGDAEWEELSSLFPTLPGARQIFVLQIELVQTSCGFGVPLYTYQGERDTLLQWAEKKGPDGIREYWREKNSRSIDGKATDVKSLLKGATPSK